MQRSVKRQYYSLAIGLFALQSLVACDAPVVSQVPEVAPTVVQTVSDIREFPQDITEIILPYSANMNSLEVGLPYTEGLIPRVGDEAVLELELNGNWHKVGQARVLEVTDEQIILRRDRAQAQLVKRVRIFASPLHRCDEMAASALDTHAVVNTVAFEDIPIAAIEHCSQAASRYSATPRFHFQLARALDAHLQERNAVARYRHALELDPDYAAAMLALAGKYLNGEGVAQDMAVARRLLLQAHGLGLSRASYLLGQMAEQGNLDASSGTESAIGFYTTAGLAGDLPAQLHLAQLFAESDSLHLDTVKSLFWHEKAALQGDVQSQLHIARAYAAGQAMPQDWTKALYWFDRAARQGVAEAQIAVAEIYESGNGLESVNLDKAMFWYQQAADQGSGWGQYHVGRLFAEGLGRDVDMEQARRWLLLAKAQGVVEAARWLVPDKVEEQTIEVVELVEVSATPSVAERKVVQDGRLRWHVRTQGYMDADCHEALMEELMDLDVLVVDKQSSDATLIITLNNPEYYSNSLGLFNFSGFNMNYRAELIRKSDNIRLFYTHGQEDGDDRNEACVDALDEIADDLDDQFD